MTVARLILPIILLMSSISFAVTTNLDSLMDESNKGNIKAHNVGFLPSTKAIKTVLPATFFKKTLPVSNTQDSVQDSLINALEQKVSELEDNQEKLSLIVASHQDQINAHTDSSDTNSKTLEILIGAITTLVAAYITAKVAGKNKS